MIVSVLQAFAYSRNHSRFAFRPARTLFCKARCLARSHTATRANIQKNTYACMQRFHESRYQLSLIRLILAGASISLVPILQTSSVKHKQVFESKMNMFTQVWIGKLKVGVPLMTPQVPKFNLIQRWARCLYLQCTSVLLWLPHFAVALGNKNADNKEHKKLYTGMRKEKRFEREREREISQGTEEWWERVESGDRRISRRLRPLLRGPGSYSGHRGTAKGSAIRASPPTSGAGRAGKTRGWQTRSAA